MPGLPAARAPPDSWGASELETPCSGSTWARSLLGCPHRPATCQPLIELSLGRACGPPVGAAARRAAGYPPLVAPESPALAEGWGRDRTVTQPPKGKGPWDFTLSTLLALPPQPGQCLFNPDRVTFRRQGRCAELFARHGFQVAPRDAHRCGRRQGWMGAGWEGGEGRAGKGREGVKAGGAMEGLGADFPAPGERRSVTPRPAQGGADPRLLLLALGKLSRLLSHSQQHQPLPHPRARPWSLRPRYPRPRSPPTVGLGWCLPGPPMKLGWVPLARCTPPCLTPSWPLLHLPGLARSCLTPLPKPLSPFPP